MWRHLQAQLIICEEENKTNRWENYSKWKNVSPVQIVENSVCTLRNLSYRLEVEMPSSRLLGNQELDTLLGFSSPVKELDYLCWGKRRRGRKRGGWPEGKVRRRRKESFPDLSSELY